MNIKTSKVSVTEANSDPKATDAVKPTEDELLSKELDLFLGGNKVPESELDNDEDETTSDDEQIDSEAPTPSETDASDAEVDESTDHEPAPLESRLEEFETKFLPKEEAEKSLQTQLNEFQTNLKHRADHINNNHFLNGLPQEGIYKNEGKTIYEMDGKQLNDYILELQDAGRAFEAAQVQSSYFKAVESAQAYQNQIIEYQNLEQQYVQATHHVEWQEVKQEVQNLLTELTQDDFDKIGQYIDNQSANNPLYVTAIQTKAGKLQKGVEALEAMGILKRLREQATGNKATTPSAPDSRVEGKKVKTKQTGGKTYSSDPLGMTQAEFNKLSEDELDAALSSEMSWMLGK